MSHYLTQEALFLIAASPFIGSFLGLVIDRLPAGETMFLGRSYCRSCGSTLGPRDLVPLLSWAASGGRCRHCGVPLGWFHPGIELAALGVALWSVWTLPGWLAVATAGLGWTLLVLAAIDQRHQILPDVMTLPLIAAGWAVVALLPGTMILDHIIGAAIGGASLAAVAWVFQRLTGREGLGLGDAKLLAAAGAWVGWQGLASVLLIGSAAGLLAAGISAHRKRALQQSRPVPFGPALALGLWITWLYGPLIPIWF